MAQDAGQGDAPAHLGDQLLADGQAQTGAPKFARGGGFGLREAGKNVRLVLGRNANAAVLHRKGDAHGMGIRSRARVGRHQLQTHNHLALRRELDRIARQVDQHLLEALGVAPHYVGQGRVYVI